MPRCRSCNVKDFGLGFGLVPPFLCPRCSQGLDKPEPARYSDAMTKDVISGYLEPCNDACIIEGCDRCVFEEEEEDMSVLDDIGIDAIDLRPEDIQPQWLIDLAEKCRDELGALPPSAQPSWYRYCRGTA